MTSAEFNNEMPLTEIECLILLLYITDTLSSNLILLSCFDTICIVKSAI